MKVIVVIGRPQQGKTPYCKKFIQGVNCIVFDPNNEYKDLPLYKQGLKRSRYFGDHVKFLDICFSLKNTFCIFEEATGFLSFNTPIILQRLIVNKAHTHNYYVFIFHRIGSVPSFLRDLTDYYVLFKTTDRVKNVYEKVPDLVEPFEDINKKPDYHFLEINAITLEQTESDLIRLLGVKKIDKDKKLR
jgi:hypothetical protein